MPSEIERDSTRGFLKSVASATDARMTSEERIDAALEDSFPASDAPWWTLGVPSVLPTTPET